MSVTFPLCVRRRRAAFTLLELLAVIGVMALLTGLALGMGRRAAASGRAARARAELTALAAALESYKAGFGDYPRTDDPGRLLQSLMGRRGPDDQPVTRPPVIEVARFTTVGALDPMVYGATSLLDPWDRAYRYAYKVQAPWTNPAYVLYSAGPDGNDTPGLLPGGFPDRTAVGNADNLYAD